MDTREQVKVFKSLFVSSRFQSVLPYYSGFTKLVNPEIREFISSYQHGKSNLEELLPLLHCFFEAHELSLCQLVNHNFAGTISVAYYDRFDPSDILAIGYFIASLLSTSASDMPPVELCLDDSGDLVCLKLLLNEISRYHLKEQQSVACGLPRKLVLNMESNSLADSATLAKHLHIIADHLKISSAISKFEMSMGDDEI